jgi:hypothetical protein
MRLTLTELGNSTHRPECPHLGANDDGVLAQALRKELQTR